MKDKFPGYKKCLQMMRKHDPQIQEDGFHLLLPHVANHVDQLMEDFCSETDHGLRCWLLELIGEARSPDAFHLLEEQLLGDDGNLRVWAIHGLRNLDTQEARKVLWDARQLTFITDEETVYFRQQLELITADWTEGH